MNKQEIVEKTIEDGHLLATKIREANSIEEIKKLKEEIEQFSDFANNNFGETDDFAEDDEPYSDLSFYLTMAIETKERHLDYSHENAINYGNEGVDTFEEYLDSKNWTIKGAE